MTAQIVRAVLGLGLPVAVLSYLLLRWAYVTGRLSRDSDKKAHRAALKEMKKAARKRELPGANAVYRKWFRFGGGFYGAAALWTLVVVEVVDLFSLITDWTRIAEIFAGGPIDFLAGFIANQIENFVTAITWFDYWSDATGDANVALLFVLAMGGYSIGARAAKAWPV